MENQVTVEVAEVAKPVQVQQVAAAQSRVKATCVRTAKTQADCFDYSDGGHFVGFKVEFF